jgi:ABC-type multidrug transport system permease subunit
VKIRITRRMRYLAATSGVYVVGLGCWWSAATGHVVGGIILLILAVTFTMARDVAYPFEVRGFPPA